MSIALTNLLTGGIGEAALDFGSKIIDKIWPDKIAQQVERDKASLALLQMQQAGELQLLSVQMSAILAEAQSADPWTSRSRPMFLYVMYLLILIAIPMGILSAFKPETATAIAHGMQAWLTAIPDSLYGLFAVGYLGYTGARSYDKAKGTTK
jgi:Holin of 3TMs, for gene-transfer release